MQSLSEQLELWMTCTFTLDPMRRSISALVLSFTLSLSGFAQSPTAPVPVSVDPPLTLDQLRQLFDVTSVAELIGNLNRSQLEKDKSSLPPWWPDDVWLAYKDAVEKMDLPTVYLPFYQPCYSQKEARMFIHLFSTPEGRAYARRSVRSEADARNQGATAEEARTDALKRDPGINPAVIRLLDADDQVEAKTVFRGPRSAAITACITAGLPKGELAMRALQQEAAKVVVNTHRSELDAAQAHYVAKQANAPVQPK